MGKYGLFLSIPELGYLTKLLEKYEGEPFSDSIHQKVVELIERIPEDELEATT